MVIRNKLKQKRERCMIHPFYTDSIRHCSVENLIKVGIF